MTNTYKGITFKFEVGWLSQQLYIDKAIKESNKINTIKASKFPQAKDAKSVWLLAYSIKKYGEAVTEKASKLPQVKDDAVGVLTFACFFK